MIATAAGSPPRLANLSTATTYAAVDGRNASAAGALLSPEPTNRTSMSLAMVDRSPESSRLHQSGSALCPVTPLQLDWTLALATITHSMSFDTAMPLGHASQR